MINFEELQLYFFEGEEQSLIDGNYLQTNILSFLHTYDWMNLLSNQYISNTFWQISIDQIVSCIDYFVEEDRSKCYVYSFS